MVEKMRFEWLEKFIPIYGEKECVRKAFKELTKYRMEVAKMGIEIEVPNKVILNGKEYTRDFLDDY